MVVFAFNEKWLVVFQEAGDQGLEVREPSFTIIAEEREVY